MKYQYAIFVFALFAFISVAEIGAQIPSDDIGTGRLLKRTIVDGVDNYAYATFSFKFGGNGPAIQKLCSNNWDLIFGNSPFPDSFDVTMSVHDRGRIKILGKYNWSDKFTVPALPAYEEPEREPSVRAHEGFIYLIHSRDRDNDFYALFRVEKYLPGESVDITWKIISKPEQQWWGQPSIIK